MPYGEDAEYPFGFMYFPFSSPICFRSRNLCVVKQDGRIKDA